MKKMCTYIMLSFLLFSYVFAGSQTKSVFSGLNIHNAIIEGDFILPGGEEQNTVDRKRAHKRKRKIRPRRNGF